MSIQKQNKAIQSFLTEIERLSAVKTALDSEQKDKATKLLAEAKEALFEISPGVPAALAATIIGVSEPTVRDWAYRGILRSTKTKPMKLSLDSVYYVKKIVEELRQRGQDAGFRNALLAAIDDQMTLQESSFQRSLRQMHEGKHKHYVDQR